MWVLVRIRVDPLLIFTILLGTGHMFLMASQQMLAVRCANARGREVAFGHFMVAVSIGQGLGPLLVGWIGGGVTVPATGPLFIVGAVAAVMCMAIALAIRPAPRQERRERRTRRAAHRPVAAARHVAVLIASVVTVTAGDLLVIYLPLLGAERNIDASHIGMLLMTRSAAAWLRASSMRG